MATATTAIAMAAGMRYPDWFKAQVVQAVTLHGLSYAIASRLYDVADETIRKWVKAADAPSGLDRLEALEYRVARIEHYLALAEAIRGQGRDGFRHPHPAEGGNGHNGIEAVQSLAHGVVPFHVGRTNES